MQRLEGLNLNHFFDLGEGHFESVFDADFEGHHRAGAGAAGTLQMKFHNAVFVAIKNDVAAIARDRGPDFSVKDLADLAFDTALRNSCGQRVPARFSSGIER